MPQVMKEPFSMCDPAFLHLVCTECEVVQLPWPKAAFPPDQDEARGLLGLVAGHFGIRKRPKVNGLELESTENHHEIRRFR